MAKVVLVTGASAGIGAACADRLARRGWEVAGASRRATAGTGWSGVRMDVDDDTSVASGVESVLAERGRIDAVVLAAGWGLAGAVEHTDLDEAKAQLETNLWGAVRVVRAVLPAMRANGSGRIVAISSLGGVVALPFQAYYSASKFALEGLCEAMAYEVAPFGVDVVLVEPGNVRTDFTAARRWARAADGDTVYGPAMRAAVARMAHDEEHGVAPDAVAAVVERVLDVRRPRRRVSVGKANERVGLLARRLLPFRAFEAAARGSFGLR
jgi:NAD(P)-dependent dehydrogenase (short-subunit alcohol dehydrogenase family)